MIEEAYKKELSEYNNHINKSQSEGNSEKRTLHNQSGVEGVEEQGESFFPDPKPAGTRGGRPKAIAKKTLQYIADLYKPKSKRVVVHSAKTKQQFALRNIRKLVNKLKPSHMT
jgi:hypothetical protein